MYACCSSTLRRPGGPASVQAVREVLPLHRQPTNHHRCRTTLAATIPVDVDPEEFRLVSQNVDEYLKYQMSEEKLNELLGWYDYRSRRGHLHGQND